MHEIKSTLTHIQEEIDRGLESINLPELEHHLTSLQSKMRAPGFWDNPEEAAEISQEADHLQKQIDAWKTIKKESTELIELLETIHPEQDPAEAQEYREMVNKFTKKWEKLSVQTFLNHKYDPRNAILSIHTGTGGKDAQDFSEMLLRMYLRWAEQNEFSTQILDQAPADEVGLKSVTLLIKGHLSFGFLKGESGVHRLIRISPFNSGGTRETSFSRVEVIPEIPPVEIGDIPKDDLRIETYRSSGAGGQSVNTTDSAVRITHVPTGLTAQCQNERSQAQNKEHALKVLHAKLASLLQEQQAEKIEDLKGQNREASWGHQIRTYTLHPYSLVKDHRTNYEEKNVQKVLDGDLEGFITAYIENSQ